MNGIVLKKRIEPYNLLEDLKKEFEMIDFTFDGRNKASVKEEFYEKFKNTGGFGLYMKNVNKFYFFLTGSEFDVVKFFSLNDNDYDFCENSDAAIGFVDMGKAEAVFIKL